MKKCLCCPVAKVSIITIYCDSVLINSFTSCFRIIVCPKILLNQRLCRSENHKMPIRVIIKVINFEQRAFNNLKLINVLEPSPLKLIMNCCDGIYHVNGENLEVIFENISPLSVKTIDYFAYFPIGEEVNSDAYLQDECTKNIYFQNVFLRCDD